MAPQITVVVAADGTTSPLRLIMSLDAQTLSTDEFELVLVDRGLDGAERDSLRRISCRRPNIRLINAGDDWKAEAGEYILRVEPDQKLFPDALARLGGFAREYSLDVVAGRPVQPGLALSAPFLTDQPRVVDFERAMALRSTVLLARRERVTANGDGLAVRPDGAAVGVLATYPASDDPALSLPGGVGDILIDPPHVRWQACEISMDLSGSVSGSGDLNTIAVVARQIGTNLSYLLPIENMALDQTGVLGAEETVWRATTRVNPLRAAAGQPFSPGTWEFDVVLSGETAVSTPATVPVPAVSRSGVGPGDVGLIKDLVVACGRSSAGALQLDVGPSRLPVIRDLDAADATVTESARGCLLRVRLPRLYVCDAETLSGQIALGRLVLPATIEAVDGHAWLTAFVSGLAGIAPLSAKFGRSPRHPLGVTLSISGTGGMTIIPTPATTTPRAAPTKARGRPPGAKAKAKRKRRKKQQPKGPLAKLRRAVPEPLEPMIRGLARRPAVRRIYRRLTGLGR